MMMLMVMMMVNKWEGLKWQLTEDDDDAADGDADDDDDDDDGEQGGEA